MRSRIRRWLSALLVGATVCSANTALACWDGYAVGIGHTSIRWFESGVVSWQPAHATRAALWARRIDALLPAGASLDVLHGSIGCEGADACTKVTAGVAPDATLEQLFLSVADQLGASANDRGRALALTQTVYTVQVFSGSAKGALEMRDRVNALEMSGALFVDGGIFVEGGFPAFNGSAHAIADATTEDRVRVVVDTFGDVAWAQAAADALRAQGIQGFVTELPSGASLNEPAFGRAD